MNLAEALSRLAKVPPKLFTRERRGLVEALKKAGQAKAARVVQARRAPTIAVWVANQLAQEHRKALADLAAAADRLKAAQLGRASAEGLAKAMGSYRDALDRFMDAGRAVLKEVQASNVEQVLSRVERTTMAALVDPAARAALQRGQLETELASPGFDVFGGARPREVKRRTIEPETSSRNQPVVTATREGRRQRKEEREKNRRQALEPLEAALTRAEEQLAAAEASVPLAKARMAQLQKQIQQARRELRERMHVARARAQAATRARRALELARRRR